MEHNQGVSRLEVQPPDGQRFKLGARTATHPEWEAIRRQVEGFAKRLYRHFPRPFTDPHATATKEKVIHWIRAALPPHPGRPRKPTVTLAYQLRRKGVPWPDIYPQCIVNFAAHKWVERRQEIRRLRNAYRGRRRLARSRRRKKSLFVCHAEKN